MLKPTLNVNFYNNHSDNSINFINLNDLFNHFNILGDFYCMKIIYCLSHVNIANNIVIIDNSTNFINFNHLFNHFNILGAFYCIKIIYCLSHVNIANNIVILFIFFFENSINSTKNIVITSIWKL